MPRLKTACLLILALSFSLLPAARAQTQPQSQTLAETQAADLADRLPADTFLYLYWRGAGAIPPGSRNALVSLWNDPGFQPGRQLILESLMEAVGRNPRLARLSREDIQNLLGHPFMFGLRLTGAGNAAAGGPAAKVSGFLVVQAGGKAEQDLRAELEQGLGGAADVRFTPSGLLLASRDPATLQELMQQFGGETAPAEAISAVGTYREARSEIGGRPPLEFYLRVPNPSSLGPRTSAGFNTKAFLGALHLERVRLLCGSIDLSAPAALAHFEILGDTSPGGLFDVFGANAASFPTLAAAPPNASIAISRLDIGAVLTLFSGALSAAMAPEQAARLQMMAALLTGTVVPALGGEYATIWIPSATGNSASMLALTVNSPAADTLFSNTLGPFLKPDGQEGEIRYYQPARSAAAAPGAAPATGLLALTPKLVLASRDESLLRSSARAVTAAAPPPGLADSPGFRAARAELPAELFGMSYMNLEKFDWTKWLERMADEMAPNKRDPQARERAAELERWAEAGGGAVLARHLHVAFAGAWKDDRGIHWRGDLH
jgi:hypothetical protein